MLVWTISNTTPPATYANSLNPIYDMMDVTVPTVMPELAQRTLRCGEAGMHVNGLKRIHLHSIPNPEFQFRMHMDWIIV